MSRVLAFALIYALPVAAVWGASAGRLWPFRVIVWLFFLFLVLDELLGHERPEAGREPPGLRPGAAAWKLGLWLWVPLQAAMIVAGIWAVTAGPLAAGDFWARMVVAISLGTTGGMVGIPIAHELMHRRGRFERGLAEALMAMVSYTHFCVEHVRGHHRRVGTPADPATARLAESFYAFYLRTLVGSARSAWHLEAERLVKRGRSAWSPGNRMLRYLVTLAAVYAGIAVVFGARGVAVFAAQGAIAFSILEALNYVEHYGLTRREIAPGRFEKVAPRHSWDSRHRVSNWFMFNLARHADHHVRPARIYLELRHHEEAPRLPAGYFAMFVLALFPPLWRRVMDPLVARWSRRGADAAGFAGAPRLGEERAR